MGRKICVLLLALCLLTGCSALLERTYSTAEPHSSKFWESEAAGTLRAENHQDVVNDLLLLIGQHTESEHYGSTILKVTSLWRILWREPPRRFSRKLPWELTPWSISQLPAVRSGDIMRLLSVSVTAGHWNSFRRW